ncbi:MAG: glycosyltransferase family 39 protein [Dehalococcoidia bacterium]
MIVVLLLVAFALRVFRLGAQSFWADEGYGLYLASESLPDLGRDILVDLNHVPLYFFALHAWIRLAGDGEFAVRYFSLAGGILTVVLTYRLGRVLFGRLVALVAAAVATVAPFQVYYSQEARMHIWTTAICLLAANALVWALDRPGDWRRWALFSVAGAVGLYTFYYAGFVLAGLSTAGGLVLLRRRDWSAFGLLAAANGAILFAFSPWAALAASRLAEQAQHKGKDFVTYDLSGFLNLNWKTFIAGVTAEPDRLAWPIWPVVLALLLGLLAHGRYRLLAPLYLAVPLAGVFLVNLRFPHFLPRYLLLATPPFYLLIAAGLALPLVRRGRWATLATPAALAAAAVVLVTSGQSLANNYFDPAYFRDDYRGVARTIAAGAQPDDVIVLNAPWQIYNFPYYYRGDLATVGLPHEDPLDPAITEPKLRTLIAAHPGVWLVLYGNASMDPTSYVETWLDEHAYKVDDTWYGTIRLARYVTAVAPNSQPAILVRRDYPGGLSLLGYELAGLPVAGEALAVRLFWQPRERPDAPYRASLRILDSSGRIWAQADSPPLEGAIPTDDWRAGERYRDPRLLALPAGLPPGRYDLAVVVYGERGEVVAAGGRVVGTIEVRRDERTDRPPPALSRPAGGRASDTVDVLGAILPDEPTRTGQPLDGLLVVRGRREDAASLTLEALRANEAVATSTIDLPALRPGELRLVQFSLPIGRSLNEGVYRLAVTGPAGSASLGDLDVREPPRRFDLPGGFDRVDRPAGGGISLAAVSPVRIADGIASIQLAWRADAEPAEDLVAFLHLVDASDRIVAQADRLPGGLPTTGWVRGEIVVDKIGLDISKLPPGEYRLWTGLYRRDGQRVGPGDGRLPAGSFRLP